MLDFISDTEHFTKVLALAAKAKETLWIGTADIKDLYVVQGKMAKPFLGVLSDLIGKGVEVRLIHAKEPGPNFREDFDRYPRLATMLERVMCPRVHFKIIVIDQAVCCVLTDIPSIVDNAANEFDKVWCGSECRNCQRKNVCPDPIVIK